ncbi:MAG: hypothetical protein EBU90_23535 [Proteobacteria bacterium]|nr:hypothetical protein [Pseudomonadota bacterium]
MMRNVIGKKKTKAISKDVQKFKVGDLVKIVEDPNSFVIGEGLIDRMGLIVEYDSEKNIYSVLLENGNKFRILDFMLKNVKNMKKQKKQKKLDESDYTKTITHCPTCGVDLNGPDFCKSINCACAPKITC